MMTIGTMPRVLSSFFRLQRRSFRKPAWPHFWRLVVAMAVGMEHTVPYKPSSSVYVGR